MILPPAPKGPDFYEDGLSECDPPRRLGWSALPIDFLSTLLMLPEGCSLVRVLDQDSADVASGRVKVILEGPMFPECEDGGKVGGVGLVYGVNPRGALQLMDIIDGETGQSLWSSRPPLIQAVRGLYGIGRSFLKSNK